jgi:hypothetical protein
MKIVLITFLVVSHSILAQEITDDEITKQHLTLIKDAEVELMLDQTPEFNDCKKDYKFDAKDDVTKRSDKLKQATECFQKKLTNQGSDALKKMAENLNLESYGLIKSKTSADITAYLSKKITKSLTGVDPDEKDPKKILASLKWENQKIVDQKVFLDLYKNQLVKSALFEVSRFCYEDLEIEGQPKSNSNIQDYWDTKLTPIFDTDNSLKDVKLVSPLKISDSKKQGSFLNLSGVKDTTDKKAVYDGILKGMTASNSKISTIFHKNFFFFCQKSIKTLCDDFKEATNKDPSSPSSPIIADTQSRASQSSPTTSMSRGANSCLTMSRLEGIKSALLKSDLVAKQFEEMGPSKSDIAFQMVTNPQMYRGGKGKDEESLDDISNITSSDMLQSQMPNEYEDLEKKCSIPGANDPACDEFLVKSDGLDKAIHNVEYNMNLKRELEVARVKSLKNKSIKELEEYLKENNMYDLLKKITTLTESDLELEIRRIYDARKIAEIESLKQKVGKRQLSETEYNSITDKNPQIQANIKDAKEERARLAQVVMFNNIITSQLELQDKDKNSLGRNVGGWNKEKKDLDNNFDSSKVENFFGDVISDAEKNGSKSEDTSIGGSGIIDMILGKKD